MRPYVHSEIPVMKDTVHRYSHTSSRPEKYRKSTAHSITALTQIMRIKPLFQLF